MSVEQPSLLPEQCRLRQQRVRMLLEQRSLDRAVFVTHENVQYLTGFRPHRLMQAAVCVDADGTCTLSAPNEEPGDAAFDKCVTFEAQWHCTIRQEQLQSAMAALCDSTGRLQQGRLGIEGNAGGHVSSMLSSAEHPLVDLDADIWRLRRHKDPDELVMIRKAVDCTEAMFRRARQIIEPGITELEVFNQLQAAAVECAGEPLVALGNDFQCNSGGGIPRNRKAQSGELFVLDLGPSYRGYYADNCRTIAVDGQPTDVQLKAWESISAVLRMVEETVKPGVSCRELFLTAKAMLDEYRPEAFCHHLGQGFGLFPHEAPHLNPNVGWDDVFEKGDCFTAEPGLYGDELRAGIRLEENYRVTADGVERLTNFSLDL